MFSLFLFIPSILVTYFFFWDNFGDVFEFWLLCNLLDCKWLDPHHATEMLQSMNALGLTPQVTAQAVWGLSSPLLAAMCHSLQEIRSSRSRVFFSVPANLSFDFRNLPPGFGKVLAGSFFFLSFVLCWFFCLFNRFFFFSYFISSFFFYFFLLKVYACIFKFCEYL